MKSRIRLIMPRGKVAQGRVSALVRAHGGRVLNMQEWMRTSDVAVAEILVSIQGGESSRGLLESLDRRNDLVVLSVDELGGWEKRHR